MLCKVIFLGLQASDLTCVTDYAITHNLTPFISMQNHYNLIHREEEREMMPSLKVCASSSARGPRFKLSDSILASDRFPGLPSRGVLLPAHTQVPKPKKQSGKRVTISRPTCTSRSAQEAKRSLHGAIISSFLRKCL
jgi:hypothetical protein